MTKSLIKTGQTLQHTNYGWVRVIQVMTRGILIAQTSGREGFKTTSEYVVSSRELSLQ